MLELCTQEGIGLPEEAVAAIFDDCVKRSDKDLALRVEARIRDSNGGASPSVAVDPLLKVLIADCDPRAHVLWCELTSVRASWSAFFHVVPTRSRCASPKRCFSGAARSIAQL